MCHGGLQHLSTRHLSFKPTCIRYFSQRSPFPCSPTLDRPQCVLFPFLCPCVLTVQLLLMSENMRCLVFCSCVSMLRMMASSFICVPAKDMISFSFLWLHSILWGICAIFYLFSLLLMGIWVGSKSCYCEQCCN